MPGSCQLVQTVCIRLSLWIPTAPASGICEEDERIPIPSPLRHDQEFRESSSEVLLALPANLVYTIHVRRSGTRGPGFAPFPCRLNLIFLLSSPPPRDSRIRQMNTTGSGGNQRGLGMKCILCMYYTTYLGMYVDLDPRRSTWTVSGALDHFGAFLSSLLRRGRGVEGLGIITIVQLA